MVTDTAKSTVLIDGKQAEEELKKLTAESKNYRQEMEKAKAANDKAGFDKAEKQYKENQKAIKSLKTELFSLDKVLSNLSGASMNQLKAAQRSLTSEMNKMTRGTKEYRAEAEKLKKVNSEIARQKKELSGAGGAFGGFMSSFKSGMGNLLGGIAIVGGVTAAFRKLINTNREFEKSLSELSALTGATGEDLKFYNKQAQEIGRTTTVSANEAVKAFTIIGSAKPELLKNKEALAAVTKEAIALAEASGMDLPQAAQNLTQAMNQFSLPAEEAGRVINVLAAGSKEGAAAIPSITDAIVQFGAVAKNANVSIEESTGLIETLAERGVVGAEAGTKLRNVLVTLQQGADDTNPAVVGMNTALENLRAKQLSTAEMAKIFGKENLVAAQILVDNVDSVKRYTDAVTGTNVAYDQQKTMTDNLDSAIKRAKNSVDGLVLSFNGDGGLTNVVKGVVNVFTSLISTMAMANKSIKMIKMEAMDAALANMLSADKKEIDAMGESFMNTIDIMIKADEKRLKTGFKNIEQMEMEKSVLGKVKSEAILLTAEETKKIEESLKLNRQRLVEGQKYIEQKRIQAEEAKKAAEAEGVGGGGSFDDQMAALDQANKQKRLMLLNDYNQQKMDKEQLDTEMLLLEFSYLKSKLALHKINGKEVADIEIEIANKEAELWNNLEKVSSDTTNRIAQNALKASEAFENNFIKKAQDDLDDWFKYLEREIESEDKLREDQYERNLQLTQAYSSIFGELGSSMGALLGEQMAGVEMSQKEFNSRLLLMMLDTLHAIVRMSIVEVYIKQLASKGFAGIATAAVLTALIEGAFAGVKAMVSAKASQRFAGKYDVIGADDGKTYKNLPVGGNPKTGIYGTPTIMFERGDELIVDHSTLNNLRLNFPHVLPTIRAAMVPQRASGNVATLGNATPTTDPELKLILRQQAAVINSLTNTLKKGLSADISYSRAKDKLDKGAAAESRASRTP